jgi:predicted phosphoadenosine phosphosulfate sulfurtransferase
MDYLFQCRIKFMNMKFNQEEGYEEFEQPKLGMEFVNIEAAYEFYNCYAFHVGFSVRKDMIGQKNDVPTWRKFCCYKEDHCRKRLASRSPQNISD